MSTTGPGRAARWAAGWTLRARLTTALTLLLVGISLAIGTVSLLAIQRFMVGQLDRQLLAAVQRSQDFAPPDDRTDGGNRRGDDDQTRLPPGTPPGGVSATVLAGAVTFAGMLDQSGATVRLPAAERELLGQVPADGRVHSRELGGSLGEYRVIATPTRTGTVVTGLSLAGVHETLSQLVTVIVAVALVGLLACALVGAAIVRRSLRPMQAMAATARRVAELPLDRGEVALAERVPQPDTDPRTEVGQVGAALNRMLGHVAAALDARQASETRMRRFVSDASHELRTPLASIRGYAELTRRSGEVLPPTAARAVRRVESEAVRMTGLVEDLLLLARLDERRPLGAAPVDLTELVVDAIADAHAAAPGHHWRLDLPDQSDQPVMVTGDHDRLHQVVANLLANAGVHTPAGSTVEVRLASGPAGEVLLRVTDDGPGIPAALVPEVFDRFARGDSSRTRDAGSAARNTSTGLGLAIVASVVEAHGGTVAVLSRPGHTEFSVLLPAAVAGPEIAGSSAGRGPEADQSASRVTSRR